MLYERIKPRMLGSLMVAMLEKTKQTLGLQLSYIEFTSVAISIAGNSSKSLFCVIFHDKSDGEDIGMLLSNQILNEFEQVYAEELKSNTPVNMKGFQDFYFRLNSIIRGTGRPVLDELRKNRAVVLAFLVKENLRDGDSSIISYASGDIDHFGVLANLKPLISAATDLMGIANDSSESIWLESSPTRASRILVHKIVPGTHLVVQFSIRFDNALYEPAVNRTIRLLKKVCILGEMMKL